MRRCAQHYRGLQCLSLATPGVQAAHQESALAIQEHRPYKMLISAYRYECARGSWQHTLEAAGRAAEEFDANIWCVEFLTIDEETS